MNKTEYEALRTGAAYQLRPSGGVLELSDNDRVDFLQRMTTNDIAALKTDQSTVTVLPSPTARVLFAFTVIAQDESLLCLPAVGQTEALSKHLRSQIFFMDKVKVADRSEKLARLRLMGPKAGDVLTQLGAADAASIDDGAVLRVNGLIAIRQFAYDIPGYELLVPQPELEGVLQAISDADALQLTDDLAYTTRRVELGRPKVEHELVEEYSPLESGMAWTCAENKGCYTGQEIIARQITYDKVTKTLVGLAGDAPFAKGDDVIVDGRSAGQVTSTAHSPTLGKEIALAVLKRPSNQPGTQAMVGENSVVVSELPLAD